MQVRKKQALDGIDREILRFLYKQSPMVGSKIALRVGITSSAVAPRLNNLKKKGILKESKISGIRSFKRKFGNSIRKIKSPRSIYWTLDLK